ncbi:hypothetical protein ACFPYI_13785 [Halomarina salina]|uniref:Uncharacterized protein n=1 Tax=Halomarina salina TaxID=1872699 RepID=A0ABD5RPU1_9EURY|nr:hypothetical protein [Halomarina salina]
MVEPPSPPSPRDAADQEMLDWLAELASKDEEWWDQMEEFAEGTPYFNVKRRPEPHLARLNDPPTLPLEDGRPDDLIWMDWHTWNDDSPVEHPVFHHPLGHGDADHHPIETLPGPAVLTREGRAEELGATPCPDCWD